MCHAYIHGESLRLLIEIYGQCFSACELNEIRRELQSSMRGNLIREEESLRTASLSRCPHPSHGCIDYVRHRRFRIRRNAADVDFAKYIAIFAIVAL